MAKDSCTLSTDGRAPQGRAPRIVTDSPNPRTDTRATPVRILLAHPPGIFSRGLAVLLAAEPGFEVLPQVADGEAAWEALRTHQPDLALLDLAMTSPSGIELARRVQAATLATRCLMLATDADPGLTSQALRAGAAGCLLKDSGFDELMHALHNVHAGGTYLSPSIAAGLRTPRNAADDAVPLSNRERQIVRLVAAGQSSKVIARNLGISHLTVETHRRRLMRKLDLHSAAEVVRYALRSGLLA